MPKGVKFLATDLVRNLFQYSMDKFRLEPRHCIWIKLGHHDGVISFARIEHWKLKTIIPLDFDCTGVDDRVDNWSA